MPRSFYRNSSCKKILGVLKRHGFDITQGGEHAKAFCREHKVEIVFPRNRKISPGVARKIAETLNKKCGISENELMKRMF